MGCFFAACNGENRKGSSADQPPFLDMQMLQQKREKQQVLRLDTESLEADLQYSTNIFDNESHGNQQQKNYKIQQKEDQILMNKSAKSDGLTVRILSQQNFKQLYKYLEKQQPLTEEESTVSTMIFQETQAESNANYRKDEGKSDLNMKFIKDHVDKILIACNEKDVKTLIVHDNKDAAALAISVMYFQKHVVDESDTSLDRKIGYVEILLVSHLVKDAKEQESITKFLISCLEDIAQTNGCQTMNLGLKTLNSDLADELKYCYVIKAGHEYYSKTLTQNDEGATSRVSINSNQQYLSYVINKQM